MYQTVRLAGTQGDGRHPYVNATGAFIGRGIALLESAADACGRARFRPRSVAHLDMLLAKGYGVSFDCAPIMGNLRAVASALNEGNLTRAAIALVHAKLPPLPDEAAAERLAKADRELRARIATWREVRVAVAATDDLAKYSPDQPRVPKGQPGGGQWSRDGGGGPAEERTAVTHEPRATQVADAGTVASDATRPQAQASELGADNSGAQPRSVNATVSQYQYTGEPRDLIDRGFLREREGYRLDPYVPSDRSGVTVATGVDLGQHTEDELRHAGVGEDVIEQVRPFLARGPGQPLLGADARAALADERSRALAEGRSIELTQDEADDLDRAIQNQLIGRLQDRYDAAAGVNGPRFADLPPAARTALASVAYQNNFDFGTNPRRPRGQELWQAALDQDWKRAEAIMYRWASESGNRTRRIREGELFGSLTSESRGGHPN